MKTKYFKKALASLGYITSFSPETCTRAVLNRNCNDYMVASISESERGVISLLCRIGDKEALDLIIDYSYTPIEERDEGDKYLVSIKGFIHRKSYLNLNSDGRYSMESSAETSSFKTHFTKAEIDKLVADPNFFLQEGSYILEDC